MRAGAVVIYEIDFMAQVAHCSLQNGVYERESHQSVGLVDFSQCEHACT